MEKEPIKQEETVIRPDPAGLVQLGREYYERGEWQPALDYLEQALAACRQPSIQEATQVAAQENSQRDTQVNTQVTRRIEAFTLNLLGGLYYYRAGRQKETTGCYQQALEISRELDDKPGEARALFNLAGIYQAEARYVEAKELLDRLVALDRELESPDLRSHLIVLGAVRKRLKRLSLAEGEK